VRAEGREVRAEDRSVGREAEDRQWYHDQFTGLYRLMGEIKEEIAKQQVTCAEKHANDKQVIKLVQGNGVKPAEVRLDRLETAVAAGKWVGGVMLAIVLLILGGVINATATRAIVYHGQAVQSDTAKP